ncbi:MAG: SDR family NAD(P)-dependent oxidoreductase, partial [Deltaproteobacteria bacterium]|nr:SDR family NAD(P)-dependent oxidoreductase [Deltaproteobacteria bacterium]
ALSAPDEAKLLADAILTPDPEPEVALRRGRRYVPRLVRAKAPAAAPAIRKDSAYWVTGGLTGLGLEVARSLVGRGARRVVLSGRRAPSEATKQALTALEERGAEILVVSADVARPFDVDRVLEEIDRRKWDLRGIVHAAGVLDDAVLLRQTSERFAKVFAPKVEGTWNLHRSTATRKLDFFTLFSGGASLMGSPGQGNYAAANAFLDTFALWRRAQGLPALAVNWGAWADVGMAAALGADHAARQAGEGIGQIPVKTGMNLWGRLLGQQGQVAVMPVDWNRFAQVFHGGSPPPFLDRVVTGPRGASAAPTQLAAASTRVPIEVDDAPAPDLSGLPELFGRLVRAPADQHPAIIDGWVHELVLRVLDFDRAKQLDRTTPLLDVGLDSLLAVELKNAMADGGVDLPVARLMTGPSIAIIDGLVASWVAEHPPPVAAPPAARAPVETNGATHETGPVAVHRPTWEQVGTWRPNATAEAGSAGGNAVMTHIGAFVLGVFAILAAYVITQIGTDGGTADGSPGVEQAAPAPASKRRR